MCSQSDKKLIHLSPHKYEQNQWTIIIKLSIKERKLNQIIFCLVKGVKVGTYE